MMTEPISVSQRENASAKAQWLSVRYEGAICAFVRVLQPSLTDADDVLQEMPQETGLTVSRKMCARFVISTNFKNSH